MAEKSAKAEIGEKKISTTIIPVLVLEVLKKYSCEKVPLTKQQIMDYIEKDYGIKLPDDKVIGRAFGALRDIAGYDIISNPGRKGGSFINNPNGMENSDLQIVIDMVKGNTVLTKKKIKTITTGLSRLGNAALIYDTKDLSDKMLSGGKGSKISYVTDSIKKAIRKKVKITFDYMRYNSKAELEIKKGHTVSPADIIYQNSKYYLIGVDEKKGVTNFRLDHITNVLLTEEKSIPVTGFPSYEEGLTAERIRKMLPNMITDAPEKVTAIVDSITLDQMIDIYGDSLTIRPRGKDEYTIEVETSVLGFRYVAVQFIKGMKVIAPPKLKDEVVKLLKKGLDKYE